MNNNGASSASTANGLETAKTIISGIPKLSTMESDPPQWIWPSFIADGAFHIISGEPGSMKSYLALQLAIGVAQGRLFGHARPARAVIYVDRENPLNMVKSRVQCMDLTDESNLCYWGLWVDNQPPSIEHPVYGILAHELKPIFIFDSLIRFHHVDENEAGPMSQITQHFRSLCSKGATVILLHHKGKPKFEGPSSPYRGSSEIAGACDIGYSITKEDKDNTSITLKAFKNRYEEEKEMKFIFDKQLRRFVPTEEPVLNKDEHTLLEIVRTVPGMRMNQLAVLSKMSETKVRGILRAWDGVLFKALNGSGKTLVFHPFVDSKGDSDLVQ